MKSMKPNLRINQEWCITEVQSGSRESEMLKTDGKQGL